MEGNICQSALKNCYAGAWSFGEICVGCNCCGRIEKGLKMWEARLSYHKEILNDKINFNNWADGYPYLIEIQKKNNKIAIKHHSRMISKCEARITAYKLMNF